MGNLEYFLFMVTTLAKCWAQILGSVGLNTPKSTLQLIRGEMWISAILAQNVPSVSSYQQPLPRLNVSSSQIKSYSPKITVGLNLNPGITQTLLILQEYRR